MKITDLREAVFGSRRKSALQLIRSSDNKELAFQMKNADAPFALIRIGDTSKWRNQLLAGYEETTRLQTRSFFDDLEQSPITILMGSRSFFESWDSNRPNVINFINIGGKDAKKFVVQSVGRGVRIEPLPDRRGRFSRLPDSEEKQIIQPYRGMVPPPETLFLFATNRNAVKSVFEGLEAEKGSTFEKLEGFDRAPVPTIGNRKMPLLIPEYQDAPADAIRARFSMSGETRQRFQQWMQETSDSVFAVRDGLEMGRIAKLRGMAEQSGEIKINGEKNYTALPFLQNRLISHLSRKMKVSDGVQEIEEQDIVHFREIRVHSEYAREVQGKINRAKRGKASDDEIIKLGEQLKAKEITRQEYDKKTSGEDEETFKDLTIKKLLNHYYLPVVLGDEKADYIKHIIKVKSEVEFVNEMEDWIGSNPVAWDAWMFSKLDESLDQIHIPYYDRSSNEYRNFKPDFIFWMCKGDDYRIVFVDPKGTAHTSAYHKIDGYRKLFEQNRNVRQFRYKNRWKVSVSLLMFNRETAPLAEYQEYWSTQPKDIFRAA